MRPYNNNPHRYNNNPYRNHNDYRRHDDYRPKPRVISEDEKRFLSFTAIDPSPRIILEKGSNDPTIRVMDMICPIGRGQRGLIVASPGAGKTTILRNICHAVTKSDPDIKTHCVLINERPEEVTDFKRSVGAKVHYSSMDESYENHIAVANQAMDEAFKDAATGKDVMLLIDSLTRLARVHNAARPFGGGRTMSGGVDAGALEAPRRIFGAARNTQEGGSITILATILIETNSRMDDVIFEEFKGTGNMEIILSRDIANRRIFPAIDINASNTRRFELLFAPDELKKIELLRRALAEQNKIEAAETLLKLIEKFPTNNELLFSFKTLDR